MGIGMGKPKNPSMVKNSERFIGKEHHDETVLQGIKDASNKPDKEGGLLREDDLNKLSTLSLLDKGDGTTIVSLDTFGTKHVPLAISEKDNNNALSESSAALSIRSALTIPLKKKLLVLDLNGLLADIVSNPPKGCRGDIKIRRQAIFKRPFCLDFLEFCFERFEVGLWSSRTKIYPTVHRLCLRRWKISISSWCLRNCEKFGKNVSPVFLGRWDITMNLIHYY